MAAKQQSKAEDPGASRYYVPCAVTRDAYDRCRKDLLHKLARIINNTPSTGDVGLISKVVADLEALEVIDPVRADPSKPAGETLPDGTPVTTSEHRRQLAEVRERQEAASDPVKMRAYNEKIAKRESIAAAREEVT